MAKNSPPLGLTLIELCFALAVVATLAGMAVPGFREVLRTTAVRTAALELMAGVQQTRSSSVVEARPGVLCLTDSAGNCLSEGAMAAGWRAFLDAGGGAEPRLLARGSTAAGVTLRATRSELRFHPHALAAAPVTLTICDEQHIAYARRIVVSQTGRARLTLADNVDCE